MRNISKHLIKHYHDPFPYTIMDGCYNEEELDIILKEFENIYDKKMMLPPWGTAAAMVKGNFLKRNIGAFVHPNAPSEFPKLLCDISNPRLIQEHPHWFYNKCKICAGNMLISYYDDGDYYKSHYDSATISTLTWFYKQPKRFSGGELRFKDYDLIIEAKHNRTLIFPSLHYHEVLPVKMEKGYENKGYGRYVISQFLNNVEVAGRGRRKGQTMFERDFHHLLTSDVKFTDVLALEKDD